MEVQHAFLAYVLTVFVELIQPWSEPVRRATDCAPQSDDGQCRETGRGNVRNDKRTGGGFPKDFGIATDPSLTSPRASETCFES